ncbi:hypothetical protein KUCAC02_016957, partial [Chaenocephalus aceratus]
MVSDSDADDFEDASEFGVDDSEMFGLGSSTCRKAPMMPENSENEADALLHFTAEFSSRYGETHPMFFIGTLEAASQEAFYGKARDMMCADSIVAYLSQNFITWAWDVTKEANKARLLTMCNTTVDELMMRLMGAMEIFTAQQLEDIKDEDVSYSEEQLDGHIVSLKQTAHWPLVPLAVCVLAQKSLQILRSPLIVTISPYPGWHTAWASEHGRLMAERCEHNGQKEKGTDEREIRETVKREQDEAYRVSLEADQRAQEKEEAEQNRLERKRKEQEDEKEKSPEARRGIGKSLPGRYEVLIVVDVLTNTLDALHPFSQAIRLSLEHSLPIEPDEDSAEQISKLRVRTPSGEFLERRFLSSCKLQVLFDFVASKGFPFEEFKLLTTFPRKN